MCSGSGRRWRAGVKMKRRLERIDESIARYMSQLETADRQAEAVAFVERRLVGLDRDGANG
jgi:hypothetical protein